LKCQGAAKCTAAGAGRKLQAAPELQLTLQLQYLATNQKEYLKAQVQAFTLTVELKVGRKSVSVFQDAFNGAEFLVTSVHGQGLNSRSAEVQVPTGAPGATPSPKTPTALPSPTLAHPSPSPKPLEVNGTGKNG